MHEEAAESGAVAERHLAELAQDMRLLGQRLRATDPPVVITCARGSSDHAATFAKYLIERGADPNVVDAYGRTALYAIVDIRNQDWSTLPNRKAEDPLPSLEILKELLAR